MEMNAAGALQASRGRILVVEDERIIARELKDRLLHMGHTVVGSVATGEQALAQIESLAPDLVLMDIKLQGALDGIETARLIQRYGGPAVVYLTAFADEDTLQRAKLTQPYGYIFKPFQERELHVGIEMALHRHRAAHTQEEQQAFRDAVLESAGDAIIACGLDGTVRLLNREAAALTGWSAAEALGRPLDEVFQVSADELRARDGSARAIVQEHRQVHDASGVLLGSARVFREVTRPR
jgi:PAS domain S-box-containing protein